MPVQQDFSDVNIEVINDKDLLKLFNELDPKVQQKIINQGFRTAAMIILKATKDSLNQVKKGKSKTGYSYLNRMFKISPIKPNDKNNIGVKLGITKEGYKYRWLEWGTNERQYEIKKGNIFKTTTTTQFTGKIQPTHFFYNAVDATKEQAQKNVNEAIVNALKNVVKKYEKN